MVYVFESQVDFWGGRSVSSARSYRYSTPSGLEKKGWFSAKVSPYKSFDCSIYKDVDPMGLLNKWKLEYL